MVAESSLSRPTSLVLEELHQIERDRLHIVLVGQDMAPLRGHPLRALLDDVVRFHRGGDLVRRCLEGLHVADRNYQAAQNSPGSTALFFLQKQGYFPRKTGRRLSTNGQITERD